jgi:hypothetical protein
MQDINAPQLSSCLLPLQELSQQPAVCPVDIGNRQNADASLAE